MHADYLKAVVPDNFTVLGVRLAPFSLGHAILLERHGCDPIRTSAQLVLAVLICSAPASRFEDTLATPFLRFKMFLWRLWTGRFDLEEKAALFRAYVTANTRHPHVASDGDAFTPGAPFLQHLKVTLQSKLNYSPQAAFDCPVGQALWDYFTLWEIERQVEIVPESPSDMFALANEMHDRLVATGRARGIGMN